MRATLSSFLFNSTWLRDKECYKWQVSVVYILKMLRPRESPMGCEKEREYFPPNDGCCSSTSTPSLESQVKGQRGVWVHLACGQLCTCPMEDAEGPGRWGRGCLRIRGCSTLAKTWEFSSELRSWADAPVQQLPKAGWGRGTDPTPYRERMWPSDPKFTFVLMCRILTVV